MEERSIQITDPILYTEEFTLMKTKYPMAKKHNPDGSRNDTHSSNRNNHEFIRNDAMTKNKRNRCQYHNPGKTT